MDAKIKIRLILEIGTNDTNMTKNELFQKALKLEQYGNSNLDARFHISE